MTFITKALKARKKAKATRLRQQAQWIRHIHDLVWMRDESCRVCEGSRAKECMGLVDQMHEDPSRAQTRGLPKEQRWNLGVCIRLCAVCHQDVTERKLWIQKEDRELGFEGAIIWSRSRHVIEGRT